MIALKIIGIAVGVFCEIWLLFFLIKGLSYLLNDLSPRKTQDLTYKYKDAELYIPTKIEWTKHY